MDSSNGILNSAKEPQFVNDFTNKREKNANIAVTKDEQVRYDSLNSGNNVTKDELVRYDSLRDINGSGGMDIEYDPTLLLSATKKSMSAAANSGKAKLSANTLAGLPLPKRLSGKASQLKAIKSLVDRFDTSVQAYKRTCDSMASKAAVLNKVSGAGYVDSNLNSSSKMTGMEKIRHENSINMSGLSTLEINQSTGKDLPSLFGDNPVNPYESFEQTGVEKARHLNAQYGVGIAAGLTVPLSSGSNADSGGTGSGVNTPGTSGESSSGGSPAVSSTSGGGSINTTSSTPASPTNGQSASGNQQSGNLVNNKGNQHNSQNENAIPDNNENRENNGNETIVPENNGETNKNPSVINIGDKVNLSAIKTCYINHETELVPMDISPELWGNAIYEQSEIIDGVEWQMFKSPEGEFSAWFKAADVASVLGA